MKICGGRESKELSSRVEENMSFLRVGVSSQSESVSPGKDPRKDPTPPGYSTRWGDRLVQSDRGAAPRWA